MTSEDDDLMNSELQEAVERLRISSDQIESNQGKVIDGILHERHREKRKRQSPQQLKKQLEDEFLTPPTAFGHDWLNKFQR